MYRHTLPILFCWSSYTLTLVPPCNKFRHEENFQKHNNFSPNWAKIITEFWIYSESEQFSIDPPFAVLDFLNNGLYAFQSMVDWPPNQSIHLWETFNNCKVVCIGFIDSNRVKNLCIIIRQLRRINQPWFLNFGRSDRILYQSSIVLSDQLPKQITAI